MTMHAFAAALIVLLPLTTSMPAVADTATPVYEAPLLMHGDPELKRGSVTATLDGRDLHLFAFYRMLPGHVTGAGLYRGDPREGGELVKGLFIQLPNEEGKGGGFDVTQELTEMEVADLQEGRLYLAVHGSLPDYQLSGRLELAEPVEFMEAPLSHMWGAEPATRGRMRATITDEGIRLVGYVNYLPSGWSRVALYRGRVGTEGDLIAHLDDYLGEFKKFDGFDITFPVETGWEDEWRDGQYYVIIHTLQHEHDLRGQLLAPRNQAPAASELLAPDDGAYIVVGGAEGEAPVDPDVYLGMISFTQVDDPDADPVAYLWQASVSEDFSWPTITFELGADSTRMHLTVARAAALVDSLARMQTGDRLLYTPVTIYHRVYTTDGAHYTAGDSRQMTLVRGRITSTDGGAELPQGLVLHGNYPNPFNPSTTVVFDLSEAGHVSLEVFDLTGRRLLTIPEQARLAGSDQRIEIDGSSLASGLYIYRVRARTGARTVIAAGRMLLLK